MVFKNDLNDAPFYVSVENVSDVVTLKKRQKRDKKKFKLRCHGNMNSYFNGGDGESPETIECRSLLLQKGIPCSHVISAYKYVLAETDLI